MNFFLVTKVRKALEIFLKKHSKTQNGKKHFFEHVLPSFPIRNFQKVVIFLKKLVGEKKMKRFLKIKKTRVF